MEDKLRQEVEKVVSAIFASKKEETMRKKTEEALKASAEKIDSLKAELADLVAERDSISGEVDSLTEQVAALTTEKEGMVSAHVKEVKGLEEAKASVEKDLETASTELSMMKKEIAADKRMKELQSAGVVREDASVQKTKVMEMSDEDFEAYKEELVSIKAKVLEALKEEATDVTTGVDKEEADLKDDVVPPANVDVKQSEQAALNMESTPSSDLLKKYEEFGAAMANAITKKQ